MVEVAGNELSTTKMDNQQATIHLKLSIQSVYWHANKIVRRFCSLMFPVEVGFLDVISVKVKLS